MRQADHRRQSDRCEATAGRRWRRGLCRRSGCRRQRSTRRRWPCCLRPEPTCACRAWRRGQRRPWSGMKSRRGPALSVGEGPVAEAAVADRVRVRARASRSRDDRFVSPCLAPRALPSRGLSSPFPPRPVFSAVRSPYAALRSSYTLAVALRTATCSVLYWHTDSMWPG